MQTGRTTFLVGAKQHGWKRTQWCLSSLLEEGPSDALQACWKTGPVMPFKPAGRWALGFLSSLLEEGPSDVFQVCWIVADQLPANNEVYKQEKWLSCSMCSWEQTHGLLDLQCQMLMLQRGILVAMQSRQASLHLWTKSMPWACTAPVSIRKPPIWTCTLAVATPTHFACRAASTRAHIPCVLAGSQYCLGVH